jgi:hypothetical protein
MRPFREFFLLLLFLTLCVLSLIFVPHLVWDAFLRDMLFTKPPASTSVLPVPADARDVERTKFDEGQDVSFKTDASEESVLRFYHDTLSKDYWVNPLQGNDHPPDYPPNIFEWHQAGPDGPTDLAYRLTITISTEPDGTKVLLHLEKFNPIQ